MATIAWSKNADNQFLVESKAHLLQIMNQGSLYTDAGDSPTNYWDASYVQTADIDLAGAGVVPIGSDYYDPFKGEYDGAHFHIMNWSHAKNENYAGLFGACGTGCVLKHIRLSGVWTLSAPVYVGFLTGDVSGGQVYDIEADFDAGTSLSAESQMGTLVGRGILSQIHGLSLMGTVDLISTSSTGVVGGVIGELSGTSTEVRHVRNLATFTAGISGEYMGGICGLLVQAVLSNCLNAMRGDLSASGAAGGIVGYIRHFTPSNTYDSLINSMVGNISGRTAGGIFGYAPLSDSHSISCSKLLNYMRGDITGSLYPSGGICGRFGTDAEGATTGVAVITESIVAMDGAVAKPVIGYVIKTLPNIQVTFDTTFGMTYETNEYGSTTMVVDDALVYHPDFTDLPYIVLEGTDPVGTTYAWDFLYANLAGHPVYNNVWTHLSLHTAEVSAPFETNYGLDAATNTTVYRTYANFDSNSIFVDDALTIVQTEADVAYNYNKSAVIWGAGGNATLPVVCEPRALTIEASIDLSLDVGLSAHLTHQATPANARETVTSADIPAGTSSHIITGLEPETLYMIRLYADDALVEKVLVTTLANTAENYNVNDFYQLDEELYDISKVGDEIPAAIVNEIFNTGDTVEVDMGFARKTTMETTFVKKGELVEIDQLEAVLLPFDPSAAGSQESTIKLSDNTSVQVSLAQGSSDVSVGGVTYPSGKSFILDGKKCTVWDI